MALSQVDASKAELGRGRSAALRLLAFWHLAHYTQVFFTKAVGNNKCLRQPLLTVTYCKMCLFYGTAVASMVSALSGQAQGPSLLPEEEAEPSSISRGSRATADTVLTDSAFRHST